MKFIPKAILSLILWITLSTPVHADTVGFKISVTNVEQTSATISIQSTVDHEVKGSIYVYKGQNATYVDSYSGPVPISFASGAIVPYDAGVLSANTTYKIEVKATDTLGVTYIGSTQFTTKSAAQSSSASTSTSTATGYSCRSTQAGTTDATVTVEGASLISHLVKALPPGALNNSYALMPTQTAYEGTLGTYTYSSLLEGSTYKILIFDGAGTLLGQVCTVTTKGTAPGATATQAPVSSAIGGVFTPGQNPNAASVTASGAQSAFSIGVHLQNPLKVDTIQEAIAYFLKVVIKIAIPFLVVFFIWSGFKFVLAQGNPTKVAEAKKMFWYTVIGMLLILGAWTITNAIIGTVNTIVN